MQRRPEGRAVDALRPIEIATGMQRGPYGSVLISTGQTRVICAASVDRRVPPWMKDQNRGWVTAEYGMMPGSSNSRIRRGTNSRATEIQRLIGRSLRGVVDLDALAGFTITLDCDVLDADGGTRTASITGAWVALQLACRRLLSEGSITKNPVTGQLAAVSVGIVDGVPLLDLDYPEDSNAGVDMNVVGTAEGTLIEVQGTAEGAPFNRAELDRMLDLAQHGISQLTQAQNQALANA